MNTKQFNTTVSNETVLKTVKIGKNVVTQYLGINGRQDIGYRLNGKRVSKSYLLSVIPNALEVINGK